MNIIAYNLHSWSMCVSFKNKYVGTQIKSFLAASWLVEISDTSHLLTVI